MGIISDCGELGWPPVMFRFLVVRTLFEILIKENVLPSFWPSIGRIARTR